MGPTGPICNKGVQGPTGPNGIDGSNGVQGPTGQSGSKGDTGAVGQNAAISSIFVWSKLLQTSRNVSYFQYVQFEQPPIGPTGSGWTTITDPSYNYTTAFVVPTNGFYLLTYKLDVRSGGNNLPTSNTDCVTVLTVNGNQIPGSTTLVEAPQENHIYTISNTVLVKLNNGDHISLLFWSTDKGTYIGDPTYVKGILPNGTIPEEATASIVFTKISE
jgi:hypothetical protein